MNEVRIREVILFWIEEDQKWHMNDAEKDFFMYPYFNCLYVQSMFPHICKDKKLKYKLTIEYLGEVAK